MPAYALLLAHDEHPSPDTEWPAEPGGSCDGWAEWFSSTPLLFSVLLGDARHLPELVPCSAYQDKQSLAALAAPMEHGSGPLAMAQGRDGTTAGTLARLCQQAMAGD